MLGQLYRIDHVQIGDDLVEVRVDVPGVVFLRRVDERLQVVAAPSGGDGVKVGFLVHQVGDATGLRVDRKSEELILQSMSVSTDLNARDGCSPSRGGPCINQHVAQALNIRHQCVDGESVGRSV